jgi:hypothetical protein
MQILLFTRRFLFLSVPLILVALIVIIFKDRYYENIVIAELKNRKNIILGNSRMQRLKLNNNSINLSLSGENYRLTYLKLCYLNDMGFSFDTIFLGFGYTELFMESLKNTDKNIEYLSGISTSSLMKNKKDLNTNELLSCLLKKVSFFSLNNPVLGNYYCVDKIFNIKDMDQINEYLKKFHFEYLDENIIYLRKCLEISDTMSKLTIVLELPMNPMVYEKISLKYKISYNNTMVFLKHKEKCFLKLIKNSTFKVTDFKDSDHLNFEGAEKLFKD